MPRTQNSGQARPARSTARYKYFHSPLTLMYVSSIRQLVPTERLRRLKTAARTGIILTDHR